MRARDICDMYVWCVKKGEGEDAGEEKKEEIKRERKREQSKKKGTG